MYRARLPGAIFAITLAALISCGPQQQVRGPAHPANGGGPDRETRDALMSAVSAAYRLDDQLWSERERIRSRDDLVQYFRRGFGRLQAEKLAAHFWVGGTEPLRAGEPLLVMPEAMKVESVADDRAELLLQYAGRSSGPVTWKEHSIRIFLRREDRVWKVSQVDPVQSR